MDTPMLLLLLLVLCHGQTTAYNKRSTSNRTTTATTTTTTTITTTANATQAFTTSIFLVCLEGREGEEGSGTEEEPHFLHDQLILNVSVQLGSTAHLHCRLEGITEQSISWYRKTGDEIQLITFDFQTYHNDDRFALNFEQPNDWRLRIRFVQRRDEGSYQCQVSTHPPLIRTIHLQVVEASIQILDERSVELKEKFYREGSTIELQCLVADVPTATALQLVWYHHQHRLNYDDPRGGVSLKTELRGSVARSWLRVTQAGRRDSGIYYCNVTNLAAASVNIHVVPDEYPAAIQRGASLSTSGVTMLASVLASLTLAVLIATASPPHR